MSSLVRFLSVVLLLGTFLMPVCHLGVSSFDKCNLAHTHTHAHTHTRTHTHTHSISQDKQASFLFLRLGRCIYVHFPPLSTSLCVYPSRTIVCVWVSVSRFHFVRVQGFASCTLWLLSPTSLIHIL